MKLQHIRESWRVLLVEDEVKEVIRNYLETKFPDKSIDEVTLPSQYMGAKYNGYVVLSKKEFKDYSQRD